MSGVVPLLRMKNCSIGVIAASRFSGRASALSAASSITTRLGFVFATRSRSDFGAILISVKRRSGRLFRHHDALAGPDLNIDLVAGADAGRRLNRAHLDAADI